MRAINTEEAMAEFLQAHSAALVLFGGAGCGVCQAVKLHLERMAREEFPELVTAHVDCQAAAAPLCATQGIFSLPVVQLWFAGQRFSEFVRVFSIAEIRSAVERPYHLAGLRKPSTR